MGRIKQPGSTELARERSDIRGRKRPNETSDQQHIQLYQYRSRQNMCHMS